MTLEDTYPYATSSARMLAAWILCGRLNRGRLRLLYVHDEFSDSLGLTSQRENRIWLWNEDWCHGFIHYGRDGDEAGADLGLPD